MNRLVKPCILMLTLSVFSVQGRVYDTVSPESVGLSSMRLGCLHKLLNDHVADRKIAGSVVLVARHGQIESVDENGLADIANR